jgi:hemerythrin-like domain-containing protein
MAIVSVAEVLEREHREIDRGIDAFLADPGGGAAPLLQAARALRRHIYIEEEVLFPPLAETNLIAPIMVMLHEHGNIWRTLAQAEAELADPSDQALVGSCQSLLQQLNAHNQKEEPVIYSRVDQTLSPTEAAKLQDFLATGEMPEGWSCVRA